MATIRKRKNSKYWQAQIRRKGWPHQSATFDTEPEAKAWARQVEADMDRGVFVARNLLEGTLVDDLLQRYAEEVTPHHKGADVEAYRLRALRKAPLAQFSLAAASSRRIAEWRDRRLKEVKDGTVLRELNLLSHVFSVARKEWDIPVDNPCRHVRRPAQPQGRDRRLRQGEEEKLLSACRETRTPWLEALVVLAIETAMRRGELLGLRWKNIDQQRRVATLGNTKNGERRSVPLSTKAMETLKGLPRSIDGQVFPCSPNAAKLAWQRAVARAKLEDLRFHDLRHEATSRLFERGFHIMEVASITGHKDLRMLRRYTHMDAAALAQRLA